MGYDLVNIRTAEGTYPINGKICDGAMTASYLKVADNISKTDSASSQSTASTYSLASYLPNDGYTYLVNFELIGTSTASTSGTTISGFVGSDLIGGLNTCSSITRASSKAESTGNSWVPIGPNRQVSIYNGYGNAGTFTLCAYIYRRIGKNPTNPSVGTWTTPIQVGSYAWNGVTYGNGKFVAVGENGYVTTSVDGTTWTIPVRVGSTYHWYGVVYGNGKFVAVSSSGYTTTSTDGTTWTTPINVGSVYWQGVTYGNGKFIVVGGSGYTTTSTDGTTWTNPVQVGSSYWWNAVTYANGKFIAVGASGYTTTSTNGTTWTTPVQVGSYGWGGLAYGNGYYAAVGSSGYFSRSSDGTTWLTPGQKGSNTWVGITFNNYDFIAVGTNGYISTSIGGASWTTPIQVGTSTWRGVTYGNGKFVAVGDSGYITTSTPCVQKALIPTADGITHENCNVAIYRDCEYNESNSALSFYYGDYAEIPHGRYTDAIYQIEFTTGSTIPVSGATTIQNIIHSERWITLELGYSSTNGTYIYAWNWATLESIIVVSNVTANSTYQVQYETHDTSARARYRKSSGTLTWGSPVQVGTSIWYGVTYGNGKFVAVGDSGYTTTSTDGTTWTTPIQVGTSAWNGITYGNGKFVAVGASGYTSTSTNGTTWTTPVQVGTSAWYGVTYGNGKFVAVSGSGDIVTSTDGTTWTTPVRVGTNIWQNVTYGNGKFIAVGGSGGSSGYITTSTNGTTWTTPVQVGTSAWYGVTYGNGKFVAVGRYGATTTSTDGTTWITQAVGSNNWYGVTYGNGKFVAVGISGYVSSSINGTTWSTPVQTGSVSWNCVTYGNRKFVAVCSNGSAVTATPNWGSWSSWVEWNDANRGVNEDYPVRLGQGSHKQYPLMDNRHFKGVINLDECYIAPTEAKYAWVPDISSITGDTDNILANLLRYNWPCNTIYCSTASPSTSSDVYFANGSTYFTTGGDNFMAKVTSYNSSTKVMRVAFYRASFDTTSIGSVDAYYNESKNISTTIPYWTGTGSKSSEIFDLVYSDDAIDGVWINKEYGSITMTLSNGKYGQPMSSYLPNDGCNYEILFDVTWVTGSAANNAANLNLYWTTDGVDYSAWMGRVKTYNAVAQEKSAIFVLGPIKSTSTLTYNVTGTTSGKVYASYHTYRKLGTRGNSIVTSVDNMSYRNGLGNVITNPIGSWRLPGEWVITGLTVAGNLTINSSNSGKAVSISLASYLPSDNFQYELIVSGEVSSGTTNGNFLTISLASSIASGRLCRVKSTTAAFARSRQSAIFVVAGDHTLSWTPTNTNSSATSTAWLYINGYRRVATGAPRI